MSRKRRVRFYGVYVAASFLALAAVLVAMGLGVSPVRLGPVAAFLMVWAGSAGYVALATRARRRRAFRLRSLPVPRGVRLRKPFWIRLDGPLTFLGLIAALGAIVAGLGFPGVGVGVLLALGLIVGFGFLIPGEPRGGLTFEDDGMRLHIGAVHCLVPWSSISDIEAIGPEGFVMLRMAIADPQGVVDSVSPDTPRNRERFRRLVQGIGSSHGVMLLHPWTAGLDGQTLERAIREGIAGRPDPAN